MQKYPLTVYKASAGSGKTFTLAVDYIKLLIENPSSYRNILAVTFTNKATEEMKMRILSQLYGLSTSDPDSDSYLKSIMQKTGFGEAMIRKRAAEALTLLVHNYNQFHVQTIDTFFQSVLRNLARELDLAANLRVELGDKQVEQLAVDEMVDELTDKSPVMGWIMSYVRETIDDNKNGNVIGKVKSFGEKIFMDDYKTCADEIKKALSTPQFFDHYKEQLTTLERSNDKLLQDKADAFFALLADHGFTANDFAHKGKGPYGYFKKLKERKYNDPKLVNSYVVKALEGPEGWVSAADRKKNTAAYQLAQSRLHKLISDTEAMRPEAMKAILSAQATMRHLYQLRLLSAIKDKVREMNERTGRFLLSDTQMLLNNMIDGSDTPFIYEKIGTRIEHMMIDEFQDTSTVQWANFKVLLKDCMDRMNAENLIVGDVKQSIYRWRSGDWRLLNDIESHFRPHSKEQLHITSLATNWRSAPRVVGFNNAFFTLAAATEAASAQSLSADGAEQLARAYADVCQATPEGRADDGFVEVDLFADDQHATRQLERTAELVRELMDHGAKAADIAILVRNKAKIQLLADFFQHFHPDLHLVSDEAFRLDASPAVLMMVDAIRVLAHPDDYLSLAMLAKTWQRLINANESDDGTLLVAPDRGATTTADSPLMALLPPQLATEEGRQKLLTMPLHDLAELLCRVLMLDRLPDEGAYLCAFFDHLDAFLADNTSNLDDFIELWDSVIHAKTIKAEAVDGIRLITIHASKGLEFEHVIMPFADWKLEKNSGVTLWCKPKEAPYNQLPLVPIDFSSKAMVGSVYEDDYHYERMQNKVDNLNLLYVAFTRAGRSLHVVGKRGTQNTRTGLLQQVLIDMAAQQRLEGCTIDGTDDKDDLHFAYGELTPRPPKANGKSGRPTANVFTQPETPTLVDVKTHDVRATFKQSNESRQFVKADGLTAQQTEYIEQGTVLHLLLSQISTASDVPAAVARLETDGILPTKTLTASQAQRLIESHLEGKEVAPWFDGSWELYNECDIIRWDETSEQLVKLRPDRVMTRGQETVVVDYKFAHESADHLRQVREYMQLLAEMGMPGVRGYVWYVYSQKVVAC